MGAAAFFIKGWEKFLLASGNSEVRPEPACGLSEARRPALDFYVWLPPPKQKQVPARLQLSPRRGAVQRAQRLFGINLLLCSKRLPRSGLPLRPVSPWVCASHLAQLRGHRPALAPNSLPSSTQGSLRGRCAASPAAPGGEAGPR